MDWPGERPSNQIGPKWTHSRSGHGRLRAKPEWLPAQSGFDQQKRIQDLDYDVRYDMIHDLH